MKNFLDRSITLRQIFRWLRWCFYLSIPIYLFLLVANAWINEGGELASRNSPYIEFIPQKCEEYERSNYPSWHEVRDSFLLRDKSIRLTLTNPIQDYGQLSPITCLGYTVIGQIHRKTHFTQEFQDASGRPVVTVRVEYHQSHPYPPVDLIEELKASRQ